MGLKVIPLTLEQANYWISVWHRHHFPVVGHRFSIGCHLDSKMVGVCVVGRPVARLSNQNQIAEVTRLATNGTPNACSILYAASARACKAMGYSKIQTFILDSEPGISLRASGWSVEGLTGGGTVGKAEPIDAKTSQHASRLNGQNTLDHWQTLKFCLLFMKRINLICLGRHYEQKRQTTI